MDNIFLYRSLTQDARSLDNLSKIMVNRISSEVRSWLDPRKMFFELGDINSFHVNDEKGRLQCLELIIDRLYVILNLNIGFLDKIGKTNFDKNVGKPKNVTLGLSASILWDKIQEISTIVENSSLQKPLPFLKSTANHDPGHKSIMHKQIQTCSKLDGCKSCKITRACISTIAKELQTHCKDDHISEARKNIQSNIFDLTHDATLNILTSAVKNDIDEIIRYNESSQDKLQNLNSDYGDILRRNEELLESIKYFHISKEEDAKQFEEMKNEIIEQQDKIRKELKVEKDKTNFLQMDVERNNEIIAFLQNKIEKLENKISNLHEHNYKMENDLTIEKGKFELTQEELAKNTKIIIELHKELNHIQRENVEIESDLKSEKQNYTTIKEILDENKETIPDLRLEIQKASRREEIISAEKELWKIRFTNTFEDNKRLKLLNKDLQTAINFLEQDLKALTGNLDDLQKRFETSNGDIVNNKKAYEHLLKRIQDVVESNATINDKIIHRIDGFTGNVNEVDFQVQGNPLFDMMKQIEVNKLSIGKLENQNAILLKTIGKFKHVKGKS